MMLQVVSEFRRPPEAVKVKVVKVADKLPVSPEVGVVSDSAAATFKFRVDEAISADVPFFVLVTLTK